MPTRKKLKEYRVAPKTVDGTGTSGEYVYAESPERAAAVFRRRYRQYENDELDVQVWR